MESYNYLRTQPIVNTLRDLSEALNFINSKLNEYKHDHTDKEAFLHDTERNIDKLPLSYNTPLAVGAKADKRGALVVNVKPVWPYSAQPSIHISQRDNTVPPIPDLTQVVKRTLNSFFSDYNKCCLSMNFKCLIIQFIGEP